MDRIDETRVQKAIEALLKWTNSKKDKVPKKAQLLEDEQLFYLVIAVNKPPERPRTRPYQISVPHPLHPLDGTQEVCLFVNDRAQGMKAKEAKAKLLEEEVAVAKVIGISKLKTDYFSFEAKRKLCGSYDVFLADDRILHLLPKLLGKSFFKKKKTPIPVKLPRQGWKQKITEACTATYLYVGEGSCIVVKVARLSQSKDEIKENVLEVIKGAANVLPKKWSNIRALYLKTVESIALPLYQALPEMPLEIR